MGIDERRARERAQRRANILESAWQVAEQVGWATFSVERVAAHAELGRATVYGYFASLEELITEMAEQAIGSLSERVAAAQGLPEALDVPVRFAQSSPAAFELLFPSAKDPRPAFSNEALGDIRGRAQKLIGSLDRLAARAGATLPPDARTAAAFVAAISLAGAVIPDLRSNTPLRRKWQDFCLSEQKQQGGDLRAPSRPDQGEDQDD